jgi:hypothetical protein
VKEIVRFLRILIDLYNSKKLRGCGYLNLLTPFVIGPSLIRSHIEFAGIFVGENKVVHFTPSFYKSPLTCSSNPKCGFRQPNSGVVRSCLDCFLENGSLYRFKYEVSLVVFLAHARDGTCSIAKSDPPEEVIHRAVYLLGSGFGKYDVLQNNSEDFALYCKTSLRVVDKENNDIGSINGQYLQWLPLLFSFVTKRPMSSVYMAIFSSILEAGKYCMKRYKTDIGVRHDVMRVAVEDLVVTTRPVAMNSGMSFY